MHKQLPVMVEVREFSRLQSKCVEDDVNQAIRLKKRDVCTQIRANA